MAGTMPSSCCRGSNMRHGSTDARYYYTSGGRRCAAQRPTRALLLLLLLSAAFRSVTAWSSSSSTRTSADERCVARWWRPPPPPPSNVRIQSSLSSIPEELPPPTPTTTTCPRTKLDPFESQPNNNNRRALLRHCFCRVGALLLMTPLPNIASARGLVQFPCPQLSNTYHFLRVGQTLLEAQDMWSTNPLFLTNRDDALSPRGVEQIVTVCRQQLQRDPPTVVKYSLAASSIDTANIVGRELRLGRDRLVPEFTFLDPRGLGGWDLTSKTFTEPAIWALDADEAGPDGRGGRPPPNTDGTPDEVLADAAVRYRQVLSILESQSAGETYLLIFPDGTGPALLSALLAGIPSNRVHELEFQPGELRMNVTLESVQALWQNRRNDLEWQRQYDTVLQRGRANLEQLRNNKGVVVNLKDAQMETERVAVEQEYQEQQELRRQRDEEKVLANRVARKAQTAASSPPPPNLWVGSALAGLAAVVVGSSGLTSGNNNNNNNNTVEDASLRNTTTTFLYDASKPVERGRSAVGGNNNNNNNTLFTTADNTIYLSPAPPVDPQEAARLAMNEYMDRDDGGNDWLLSLNDILLQDDENAEVTNPDQDDDVDRRHDDYTNSSSSAASVMLRNKEAPLLPQQEKDDDYSVVPTDEEESFQ